MSADTYLGIQKEYSCDYKQGGSKFLGFIFPCSTNEDFEQKIKVLKETYADATHVCSACVLGLERDFQKFSDDGEPSNSAGRPILHALLSQNVTYVGCAVVRYYGGKKLGVPGLIEAYGQTAIQALEGAKIELLTQKDTLICTISPQNSYLLYNFLQRSVYTEYRTENERFIITIPKSMTSQLLQELKNINTLAVLDEN